MGKIYGKIKGLFVTTDEDSERAKTWKWLLFFILALACGVVGLGCMLPDSDLVWVYIIGIIVSIPLVVLSFRQASNLPKKIVSCIPLLAAIPLIMAIIIIYLIIVAIRWIWFFVSRS